MQNECLNRPIPYHESVDLDDLEFQSKLHFPSNVTFGDRHFWAIQDCFTAGTKERNFSLASINEKMCALKEIDMNVGVRSIAQNFGILTSVL